jgi:uncharacterized protein (DUF362 family)
VTSNQSKQSEDPDEGGTTSNQQLATSNQQLATGSMKRRKFIQTTSLLGASAAIGMSGLPLPLKAIRPSKIPDISIVEGEKLFANTMKALEAIGGIGKFVSKQDIVGILINGDFETKGTYVHPEVPLAVIDLCYEAGARDVIIFQHLPDDYWDRTDVSADYAEMIHTLNYVSSNKFPAKYNVAEWMVQHEVIGAKHIKDIEIIRAVFECDVFINIPIAKHHNGTLLTATLKNMMGLLTRESNVKFHLGSGQKNDPEYLGQCIADLNLVRKPDLVVMDASEFLISNGPAGPGEMDRLDYVLAGTDPVAMDVLAAEFIGLYPEDVITIQRAYEHGIGEMDKNRLEILKTEG